MPAPISNADLLTAAIKAKAKAIGEKVKARWAMLKWKYGKVEEVDDDNK